jgi:hypothetical protein
VHPTSLLELWLLWLAASTAGFVLAALACWALIWLYGEDLSPVVQTLLAIPTVVIMATAPGFLHWLILRQRFAHAAWWIPASGIGSVSGLLMLSLALAVADPRGGGVGFSPFAFGWLVPSLAVVLGGAVGGSVQWLALRHWVTHAAWWIPVSSLSWIVTTWTYLTFGQANHVYFPAAVASGAFSGAITGFALVCLLRYRRDELSVRTR